MHGEDRSECFIERTLARRTADVRSLVSCCASVAVRVARRCRWTQQGADEGAQDARRDDVVPAQAGARLRRRGAARRLGGRRARPAHRERRAGGGRDRAGRRRRRSTCPGPTLLPGLIDAHSHVLLHAYNETSWNDQVLHEAGGAARRARRQSPARRRSRPASRRFAISAPKARATPTSA